MTNDFIIYLYLQIPFILLNVFSTGQARLKVPEDGNIKTDYPRLSSNFFPSFAMPKA